MCHYTKDELINYSVGFFFSLYYFFIYSNDSAPGCGCVPLPCDFPFGRINYNIHLDQFSPPRQQMSSFSNYNGPQEPFFPLHRPKNIPLLKCIYFEIVDWQKISRKITCSAAANVIRQTRSSFLLQTGSTCSADSLGWLLADVSFGSRAEVRFYFHVVFRHNDGKVT